MIGLGESLKNQDTASIDLEIRGFGMAFYRQFAQCLTHAVGAISRSSNGTNDNVFYSGAVTVESGSSGRFLLAHSIIFGMPSGKQKESGTRALQDIKLWALKKTESLFPQILTVGKCHSGKKKGSASQRNGEAFP